MTQNELEIAWLAGLLEGEGCFQRSVPSVGFGKPKLQVYLKMTDHDTVERAARMMGTNVHGPKQRAGRKPYWTTVASSDTAAEVMRAILPFMGARRRARIEENLALLDTWLVS